MSQFSGKVYKTVLLAIFFLIGANGCKDNSTSVIPYKIVDMQFNPTSYIELNVPGGSVYFPGVGFGGIIVFRDLSDSSNPYLAYDAACPYEIPVLSVVANDGSGVATCPKCGSQFILYSGNGSPIKGPASQPLKQYHTSFIGGLIIIRN